MASVISKIDFVIAEFRSVIELVMPDIDSKISPSPRSMLPSFRFVLVASSEVFSVESSMSFVLFFIASSF